MALPIAGNAVRYGRRPTLILFSSCPSRVATIGPVEFSYTQLAGGRADMPVVFDRTILPGWTVSQAPTAWGRSVSTTTMNDAGLIVRRSAIGPRREYQRDVVLFSGTALNSMLPAGGSV